MVKICCVAQKKQKFRFYQARALSSFYLFMWKIKFNMKAPTNHKVYDANPITYNSIIASLLNHVSGPLLPCNYSYTLILLKILYASNHELSKQLGKLSSPNLHSPVLNQILQYPREPFPSLLYIYIYVPF